MPTGIPGDRQNDGPVFVTQRSVAQGCVRRNFGPERFSAVLFTDGARYTFSNNVRVPSLVDVESGEWVGFDPSTGKLRKAVATVAPAWPVFQGGSKRFDLGEGGLTVLEGIWEALTNMVDTGDWQHGFIRVGDELVVGTLPAAHPESGRTGLINYNDKGAGSFYVVAHVEDIYLDADTEEPNGWVVVNNVNAGYHRTKASAATTAAPTT